DSRCRAAVLQTLQQVGVFAGDRRGRYLGHAVGVAQGAGVWQPQPWWPDRTNERRGRAERCGARGPIRAELHRLAVIRERDVVENDSPVDAAAVCIELFEAAND